MLPKFFQQDLSSDEDRDENIKELTTEFINTYPDVVNSVKEAAEALGVAIKSHMTAFVDFANALSEFCSNIQHQVQTYPNRRVKHLAVYGRTERIRKKNTNRILREIEKKVN